MPLNYAHTVANDILTAIVRTDLTVTTVEELEELLSLLEEFSKDSEDEEDKDVWFLLSGFRIVVANRLGEAKKERESVSRIHSDNSGV